MDRATVDAYERGAADYVVHRRAYAPDDATAFARAVPAGALRADLGCGPGHYTPHLGTPVVALDAAGAMLCEVPDPALRVQADLEALPLRRGSLAGAWACKSYQHVARDHLPEALADLHRTLALDAPLDLTAFAGEGSHVTGDDDRFAGRRFTLWSLDELVDVVEGAGFEVAEASVPDPDVEWPHLRLLARRARTLPDRVAPGLRLLVCGLNPSLYAADAGVPFARPGNRFWPAALAAGLVERDRDPGHALRHHGVGWTDLVKRASVGADELSAAELRAGAARVGRLCERASPRAVCLLGLTGWRAAVDRSAVAGWQDRGLGGAPVYLCPNPSGRNASTTVAAVADHLRAALAGP